MSTDNLYTCVFRYLGAHSRATLIQYKREAVIQLTCGLLRPSVASRVQI